MLFAIYLAAAECETLHKTKSTVPVLGLSLEVKYTYYVYFMEEKMKPLGELPIVTEQLENENFFMNQANTELTHVYISDTHTNI